MGITGLLPFLKNIQKDVHVSSFKGMKVAVDAYCWLHKGSYSCATQIVMKTGDIETLPFVNYCVRRVNLLRQHGIIPIMVFDGGYLPTKENTEKERREKRQSYRSKGKELLKQGKKSEAHDCFQKCVDISPEMALVFIKECRKLGVECIVAPYEADAQLAYLSKEDIVDVIITEDSDLLVFGAKRVLYKMDESGNGKLIELKDLVKANKSLIGFTPDSFRQMCILSGCDYLPSVPGIGLGKASKLMKKHNQNSTQVIRALRFESSKVPHDYDVNFRKAEYTFLYQLVFDPRSQKQVHLNELPAGIDPKEFEFAGVEDSPRKAVHMARGNINPITKEVLDSYSPSKEVSTQTKSSSWSCSVMGSANKKYPMPIQAKLTLSSSAKSTRPFKAPSISQPVHMADEILCDDELKNFYSCPSVGEEEQLPDSGSNEKPQLTQSRFFDAQHSNDHDSVTDDVTPENKDCQLKSCARKLYSETESTGRNEIPTISSQSESNLAKKRLFESRSAKLSKFAFVNSKRRKTQDQVTNGYTKSPRKNPFSKAEQSTSHARLEASEITTPNTTLEEDFDVSGSEINSNVSPIKNNLSEVPDKATTFNFSSSSNPFKSTQEPGLDYSHIQSNLAKDEFQSASLTEDEFQPVNLTEDEQSTTSDCVSLVSPVSLTRLKFGKRKASSCKRVGLSKKVKPPRLSDPGPKQIQLSAFNFTRKPKMKF